MRAARQEGKRVKFVGKRLYINDTLFRPNADNQNSQDNPPLNIVSWNVNGLKRKLDNETFIEYISNHDLILLCETWLIKEQPEHSDTTGYISVLKMDKKQVTQVEDAVVVV